MLEFLDFNKILHIYTKKRGDFIKSAKVIFHIKPIPSHMMK